MNSCGLHTLKGDRKGQCAVSINSLSGLAQKIGVSWQTANELLRERRAVSPAMAMRPSRLFGNTPEFWLNAQRAVDLWNAKRENKLEIEKIKPLEAAQGRPNLGKRLGFGYIDLSGRSYLRQPLQRIQPSRPLIGLGFFSCLEWNR